MKKLTVVLLILVLTSCNQSTLKNKASAKQDLPDTTRVPKGEPTGFGGNWINKKYVEKLLETKSPKASQGAVPVTLLDLPDEVDQYVVVTWHMDDKFESTVKKVNGQFSIPDYGEGNALTLNLENDVLKTEAGEFIKLNHRDDNFINPVSQFLFAGTYNWNGKHVEFTKEGRVIGIDSIERYGVSLNFYSRTMELEDEFYLKPHEGDGQYYGFKFSADTLILYEQKKIYGEGYGGGPRLDSIQHGKILYKMIKE